jgi:isoleucyl-tRNA synthetase
VLEGRAGSRWPADLYLEGSDQHRGWFQSSLLESSGTRGRAPFNAVMTHGFTLDEKGEKMSKSGGNAVDPQSVIKDSGADILRLWAAMVDYADDQRIGKTILQTTTDAYRKIRNTLRYLLGALAGFEDAERVDHADMPPLERYVLHRLWELDRHVRAAYENYLFQDAVRPITEFCQNELSALFFDIRRDALYCDKPDSLRRRAARTVMDLVFERLVIWLSPVLAFTAEEAWTTRRPDQGPLVFRTFPETPDAWRDEAAAGAWGTALALRRVVTGALELSRREKLIGASLEAHVEVYADGFVWPFGPDMPPEDVMITSSAAIKSGAAPPDAFRLADDPNLAVVVSRAEGRKCARSWKILPSVGDDPRYPDLTPRDAEAVAAWDAVHGR